MLIFFKARLLNYFRLLLLLHFLFISVYVKLGCVREGEGGGEEKERGVVGEKRREMKIEIDRERKNETD